MGFEVNGVTGIAQDEPTPHPTASDLMRLAFPNLGISMEVRFEQRAEHDLVMHRVLTATRDTELHSIRDGRVGGDGEADVGCRNDDVRVVHTSHLRSETFPRSRHEYPYVRVADYDPVIFGGSECNDIPWLMLTDEHYRRGLVVGSLNDGRWRRLFHAMPRESMSERGWAVMHAEDVPAGHDGPVRLKAGESVELPTAYYQILTETHPREALAGYLKAYSEQDVPRYGTHSTMRHGGCYCTWNYVESKAISHDLLIKRASVIARKLPGGQHFMLDDGYQANDCKTMDGFYPDPAANVDRDKFPHGLRAFAEGLEELGLVPGIWLTPLIRLNSRLADEQPDWLLRGPDGMPMDLGGCGYIDLSVEDARSWADNVLLQLYGNPEQGGYGFRGCKLDFQSQMFDVLAARYRRGTVRQWRDWYYGRIRELIGESGFFETCIAMSMGDPHLSRFCDGYRLGADITPFTWERHVGTARWALPALSIPGREFALLNLDSFGFDPEASLIENRSRATWCFITGGLLEYGGPLELFNAERLDLYARMLEHADRGHPCRVVDEEAFVGVPLPRVCVVRYPSDSRTFARGITHHIALLNWTDRPQMTGGTWQALGVSVKAKLADFWDGDLPAKDPAGYFELLPARGSRLITVLNHRDDE